MATSELEEDQVLSQYLCGGRVEFWVGDAEDVISRFLGACDHFGVDVAVRVTADCPTVSPEIAEFLLAKHFESGADYTAAAEAAVGTSCEIIEVSALRTILGRLGRAEYSEYMTWYFRNNPDLFRLNIVQLPAEIVRQYRLTLDYPEDLEVFENICAGLGRDRTVYPLTEIFAFLDSRPDIAEKNAHLELKYVADKELIAMLNEKTRIPTDNSVVGVA